MQKNSFLLFIVSLCAFQLDAQTHEQKQIQNGAFTIKTNRYGISELLKTNDVHVTNYVRNGRMFGDVTVRFASGRKVDSIKASAGRTVFSNDGKMVDNWQADSVKDGPLQLSESFSLQEDALVWTIQ